METDPSAISRRQALKYSGLAAAVPLASMLVSSRRQARTRPDDSVPTQSNWLFCTKCYSLFWYGYPTAGVCPDGGAHSPFVSDSPTNAGTSWDFELQIASYAAPAPSPGARRNGTALRRHRLQRLRRHSPSTVSFELRPPGVQRDLRCHCRE
jgi:hypothetical protein